MTSYEYDHKKSGVPGLWLPTNCLLKDKCLHPFKRQHFQNRSSGLASTYRPFRTIYAHELGIPPKRNEYKSGMSQLIEGGALAGIRVVKLKGLPRASNR